MKCIPNRGSLGWIFIIIIVEWLAIFHKWIRYVRVLDVCSVKEFHVWIPADGSLMWLLGSAVNDLTDNIIAMENPLYIYKLCLKQ